MSEQPIAELIADLEHVAATEPMVSPGVLRIAIKRLRELSGRGDAEAIRQAVRAEAWRCAYNNARAAALEGGSHEDLIAHLKSTSEMLATGTPEAGTAVEARRLLAEVVEAWRAGDTLGGHEAIGNAERYLTRAAPLERSAADERADVVAWLRIDAEWGGPPSDILAGCIERGDHVGASKRGDAPGDGGGGDGE